ncbi:IS4 family transposase [Algoriphagus persicinus]|uniref:IS4 family transposase n=1 Tax=Algoriphagus persicinus TaxID=3108754 RepID=UPI002B3D444B|nr:IS4 family transposase [Algoriphagus sp. E1-3-M2]MEB2785524.1 IS4 family transposase [Algoriphagus sp. E1-3-M2]
MGCCGYHTTNNPVQHTKLSGHPIISQLLSFIPRELVDQASQTFQSDRYYKTMSTWKQLVFMLYGVVSKAQSLNSLCKCLLFLGQKLSYLGINKLPASSTLSDANRKRPNEVFGYIYYLLLAHYRKEISDSYLSLPINGEVSPDKVKLFDSSTVTLFTDVFKGAGRNPMNGKKKGGLKVHALLPLDNMVPELVWLTPASSNDKDFLGQLKPQRGEIYVFDKWYVNYVVYKKWTESGAYFVTRLNENASYGVVGEIRQDIHDFLDGVTILDQLVELKTESGPLKARLITYKDPLTGKVFRFLSNLFDAHSHTIVLLYKNRGEIEPFFKKIKQNFELGYFFSDSREGIKTQVWMVLIANLIFSVIQTDKRSRAVYYLGVHGQSQPDILCLIPDYTKNELPDRSRTKSGNSTIGNFRK